MSDDPHGARDAPWEELLAAFDSPDAIANARLTWDNFPQYGDYDERWSVTLWAAAVFTIPAALERCRLEIVRTGDPRERGLAEAIHHEIITSGVLAALDIWHESKAEHPGRYDSSHMLAALGRASRDAIEAVLARRRREAARTGPWEGTP